MISSHWLKFEAARVSPIIPEETFYAVEILANDRSAVVSKIIPWDQSTADFLANFDTTAVPQQIQDFVMEQLRSLQEALLLERSTFSEAFSAYETETGEPGVQLILDI